MSVNDALIQAIVEKVLAKLAAEKPNAAPSAYQGMGTGAISSAQNSVLPTPVKSVIDEPVSGPALDGFVTVRRLEDAQSQYILLTDDAKLTPAAQDYVKEQAIVIRRESDEPEKSDRKPVMCWTCNEAKEMRSVKNQLAKIDGAVLLNEKKAAQMLKRAATAIKNGEAEVLVCFVKSGAVVNCMANRCPSLRAVVGTCEETVQQAIAELGVNVLIVEAPHHDGPGMRAVVDHFLRGQRTLPNAIAEQIKELGQCA